MSRAPAEPLRVLLVEDEYLLALDLGQMLEDEGCTVAGHFASLAEARDGLDAIACDVAFVDLNLGGEPSDEIRRTLMARGVPVVVVTGYATSELPPELGATAVLEKPLQPARLRALLARLREQLAGPR